MVRRFEHSDVKLIFASHLLLSRGEKKTICNKVVLQSAATCLVWPGQQPSFIFGQADGKASMY